MSCRHREIWQPWRNEPQIEGTRAADLGSAFNRTWIAGEPLGHLGPRAQVGRAGRGQPAVHVVKTTTTADGGQCRSESAPVRGGVMRVGGGNHAKLTASG